MVLKETKIIQSDLQNLKVHYDLNGIKPGPNYWAWVFSSKLWGITAVYYSNSKNAMLGKHNKILMLAHNKEGELTRVCIPRKGLVSSNDKKLTSAELAVNFQRLEKAIKVKSFETIAYEYMRSIIKEKTILTDGFSIGSITIHIFNSMQEAYESIYA